MNNPDGGRDLHASYDIAIIGAGFSGVSTAYHLLRDAQRPLRCAVIECRDEIAAGVAYQTKSPHHILNVRVKAMSLSAQEPESFLTWLKSAGKATTPDSFESRCIYRDYLVDNIERVAAENQSGSTLTKIRDTVVTMARTGTAGFELALASGVALTAKAVVVALGNVAHSSKRDDALLSPWNPETYRGLSGVLTMAIVGAGLTAIDIILEAEAAGFRGKYSVISRHGKLPKAQSAVPPLVTEELKAWMSDFASENRSLREFVKLFHQKLNNNAEWAALIDSMRPHTQRLWIGLSVNEKRAFLRHFRSQWDIHRHRAPDLTLNVLLSLQKAGRLESVKAGITGSEKLGSSFRLQMISREGKSSQDFDRAVNGMGLFGDVTRVDSPLMQQLLRDGYAVPDDLRLGLHTTAAGELISAENVPQKDLFTLGSLRRGELWESIAVPELKVQAGVAAAHIIEFLG